MALEEAVSKLLTFCATKNRFRREGTKARKHYRRVTSTEVLFYFTVHLSGQVVSHKQGMLRRNNDDTILCVLVPSWQNYFITS